MRPVAAWLRSRGIHLIVYLNDVLIMAEEKELAKEQTEFAVRVLEDLGFVVNKKSCVDPSQEMQFLGFLIQTLDCVLKLPMEKIKKIRKEVRRVRRADWITLRQLARLLGLLSASIQAIFPAPLHYRALQRLKGYHPRKGEKYSQRVMLNQDSREELDWWLMSLEAWNGRAIFGEMPEVEIESDASLYGWGARCGMVSTGGLWSKEERMMHINCLVLLAGSFAIKSFLKDQVKCCVLLKMDNLSAVRYVNKMGGPRSKGLADLAKEFWRFCLEKEISVQAQYIPGQSNIEADWYSRNLQDVSNWRLDRGIFVSLHQKWGPFHVDLFADRLNCQQEGFYSWRPDPEALGIDAFLQDWSIGRDYEFPQFSLIQRVIAKLRRERAELVLITPFWRSQVWFPDLMSLLVEHPILLPGMRELILDPEGNVHDLVVNGQLRLMAWLISGEFGRCRDYRERLRALSQNLGHGVQPRYINQLGEDGLVGVVRDLDPVSAPVVEVVNYLSNLFRSGLAYNTVNINRSAISSGHVLVGGFPVGQHLLVRRLIKSVRVALPPKAKYGKLWDVSLVLTELDNWGANSNLNLRLLSWKLVMLLCLVSFRRVSDVKALEVDSRFYQPEGVCFELRKRSKTMSRTIFYPLLEEHGSLCVVNCLREYEKRTIGLRQSGCSQLLISYRKPFRAVSKSTLSRWVREVMAKAGVDVSVFGAHSVRGAVASKAFMRGFNLSGIMKAADWSHDSTFKKFYFKPVENVIKKKVMDIL